MLKSFITIACLMALLSSPAVAQTMPGMDMNSRPSDAPATRDFRAGMADMDKDMGHYTGNADQDFVANMIPHHQGAIAMARTELKYGTDPALKKLAQQIVTAQNREIAFMKDWQAQHH